MASGTAALAAKLVSKKSNNSPNKKKSPASRKTSSAKGSKPRSPRTNNTTHPWAEIKRLYESGMKRDDIAKKLKIKVSSMNGIMDRLAAGTIMVNGKVISVVRGNKRKSGKSKGK